ncbi:unknown [Firmicutes bacterium CAG:137]|nr:unknown [Firmicutes bacterium CAG:137]
MSSPPWQAPESGSTSTFPRLWASHPTHPVRRAARQSESPARAGTHCGQNTASTIPLAPMFIPLASPICKHFGCIIAQILTEYQREIHIRRGKPGPTCRLVRIRPGREPGPASSAGASRRPHPTLALCDQNLENQAVRSFVVRTCIGEALSKPRRTQRSGHCQG